MRVVVVGATGNVGTSVLRALAHDGDVKSILGLARRRPDLQVEKVEWAEADITTADLVPHFRGADAVIHLAWLIQPSHDEELMRETNVKGSDRLFRAVAEAGVPRLVYASSVGAYSPGPKDRAVDESHPTGGVPNSFYARHKAEVERILDRFEREKSSTAVVRLRPALIFKGEAAAEIRRLFAGPFLPNFLIARRLIPLVPAIRNLRFQAVHSYDVGEAYRLAVKSDAHGAFNIAADPVLDARELGKLLDARPVPIPTFVVRTATAITWRLRLQPTGPGWLDMALQVPLLDTGRARRELGWSPRYDAGEALLELMEGLRRGRGLPTPPLDADAGGPARTGEIRSRIGGRP